MYNLLKDKSFSYNMNAVFIIYTYKTSHKYKSLTNVYMDALYEIVVKQMVRIRDMQGYARAQAVRRFILRG